MTTHDFRSLIEECRSRLLNGRRALLTRLNLAPIKPWYPGEDVAQVLQSEYKTLFRAGTVVWGAIAQANTAAYIRGDLDLPANSLYTLTSSVDARPGVLLDIAAALGVLKGTAPDDPALAECAAIMTNESNGAMHHRLPARLVGPLDVYISSTILHRHRLPGRILTTPLLPLVVAPGATRHNMILPQAAWPPGLAGAISDAESAPGANGLLAEALSRMNLPRVPARKPSPDAPIRLSPEAAAIIRGIIRQQRIPERKCYVRVGFVAGTERGAHDLKITGSWDATRDSVLESEGLRIVVARSDAPHLAGITVNYLRTPIGEGFSFDL